MKEIGNISLSNNAGFVVRLEFEYYNESTYKWVRSAGTGDITLGFSKTADPGEYGVPEGCLVRLYANVVWGTDKVSDEMFLYRKRSSYTAMYAISGTTQDSNLEFRGVSTKDLSVAASAKAFDAVSLGQDDILPDLGSLSKEEQDKLMADIEGSPFAHNGSWGPISWNVAFNLDLQDISNSSADVKVSVFSVNIIDAHIDVKNPKVVVDLTVAGVGVTAELGIDFSNRTIYLKGKLNFIFYTKDFNITLLSF